MLSIVVVITEISDSLSQSLPGNQSFWGFFVRVWFEGLVWGSGRNARPFILLFYISWGYDMWLASKRFLSYINNQHVSHIGRPSLFINKLKGLTHVIRAFRICISPATLFQDKNQRIIILKNGMSNCSVLNIPRVNMKSIGWTEMCSRWSSRVMVFPGKGLARDNV